MSESKHTPGPWTVQCVGTSSKRGCEYRVLGADRGPGAIAYVCRTPHVSGWADEREANVRLIASAPDLLRIVRALVNEDGEETGDSINAALAEGAEILRRLGHE